MGWRKWSAIVSLVVLLLSAGPSAYAHQQADGNARVEVVHEPTFPPALERVRVDRLYDANPAIRVSGWSWAAVSMTDPQLGDCHNGTTNPVNLRALRFGWLKNSSMLAPELMVAWITYNNTIRILYYGDYPSANTKEIFGNVL
jgi:hypothetical protein